jgi:transposase
LSIRALAERHGVHRRAVRQALVSPVPPAKRAPVARPVPKLGAYRAVLDAWLVADCDAPRKQCHTARRVWQRLVAEHGSQVSERQVRRYVRERRVALVKSVRRLSQLHAPGIEGEVDWGRDLGSSWPGGARRSVRRGRNSATASCTTATDRRGMTATR